MGLTGLCKCVKNEKLFKTAFHLHDTKLVIDGYGLLRHLFDNRMAEAARFGGEYEDYRMNCMVFFNNLQQCCITPYVVFDGAWDLDDKKYSTHIRRHQEKLDKAKKTSEGTQHACIIPLFAWSILQGMANQREDVFTVTVDFEADEEIAALANQFNCPVLANDNDFFIYPLLKGYIPFQEIDWEDIEIENRFLECSIFSDQDQLCQKLRIEKRRLPLLATIRGNDYLSPKTLKPFHNSITRNRSALYYELGNWLSRRSEMSDKQILDEVLDILTLDGQKRQDVATKANQSIQTYSMSSRSHIAIDSFTNQPYVPQSGGFERLGLPVDLVKNLRKGNLHSMWINVLRKGEYLCVQQVEDFSQCSANDISKEIRKVIYAVLLEGKFETVREHDRVSGNQTALQSDIPVPRQLTDGRNIPTISDAYELETEERKALLLASLGQTDSVLQFEDHLQLPMAVTRYWFRKSRCPEHIARGLLIGFLLYTSDVTDDIITMQSIFNDYLKPLPRRSADHLPLVHAFAQWQSCLMFVSDLNVLLNDPLPDYSIARLFNGCKTYQLADFARDTDAFEKTLEMVLPVKSEFMKMWNYICPRVCRRANFVVG